MKKWNIDLDRETIVTGNNDSREEDHIWKKARSKPRSVTKGRPVDPRAVDEVRELIGESRRTPDMLIEFLHLLQDKYGCLHLRHMRALADEVGLSQADVYGVASFYSHFDIVRDGEDAPPEVTIRVCNSFPCCMNGADELYEDLQHRVQSSELKGSRVLRAPCMGLCDKAPAVEVGCVGHGRRQVGGATTAEIIDIVNNKTFTSPSLNFTSLDKYKSDGGYDAYMRLVSGEITLSDVCKSVSESGLRGMGGAGFPTARKWSLVLSNSAPRYMAVNADEGEPGTFKDRLYLETEPHAFLEGVLIAARVVEAQKVYIYVRDEYIHIIHALLGEICNIERAGIVAPGYLEIRRGAGAYICGEESSMIESIEGKRGLPRNRPPYVAEKGLFGCPTLVHNVETLVWVSKIVRNGPEVYNAYGLNGRVGIRAFSVSGRVNNPGVKFAPAGITLRQLISEYCGGMQNGGKVSAYLPGGASGGILPGHMDDIPLDFDVLQQYDCFIGSAAVIILSEQDNVRDVAVNMMKFFEHETCGQCTPCRVGCEKAVKLMQDSQWNIELIENLGEAMVDASICGLGQAAPNVFRSVIKYWRDLV